MRSRRWVTVTVIVVLAGLVLGTGAALLSGSGSDTSDADSAAEPSDQPSLPASVRPGVFELRQVLFQETGQIQLDPPLRPGPAEGGENATRDLLRVDCNLKPRPMKDDDNVILCDGAGFRYGLGPSELPRSPVASATAVQDPQGAWLVNVALTDGATPAFQEMTGRLANVGPPLNQVAVVINGAVVTAPGVSERINGNQVQVTGPFTQQEAEALAASLG
ncbi:MAG TPA: hypothetical protein VFX15_13165 [Actinomycetes bacterium]|nr:hypothetical protein [Actinomycetes bacterium]